MRRPPRSVAFVTLPFALAVTATAQTALVEEGDVVSGVGNVTSIANLAVNDSGAWIVEVDTDNADTDIDAALLNAGGLMFQEGQALALPVGATLNTFDTVNINNSGDSCWNFFLSGTSGLSDDSGIYFGGALVLQEGDFSTAAGLSPSTPYTGFFEVKINDAGDALVMASVDDPAIASTTDRALIVYDLSGAGSLLSETVIAKEGDVLNGQTEMVADFGTGPHNFAFNDLGDVMFVADLTGDPTVDFAVYVDDQLLAQEGSASPVGGRNWSSLSGAEVDLNDACEWVISGSLDGDTSTNLLIERNGAKFRQEGDSLAAFSPFLLTSFGSGPVLIANSGEVLWYGDWDDPDTTVDTGLFIDDQLIVQEGVSTIGGVIVDEVRGITDGYSISPNGRYVIFEALLADGTEGAYLLDRGVVAHQELRNGSGLNPVCLKPKSTPALGTTWTIEMDVSGYPGGSLAQLLAYAGASSGTFVGAGEILVDVSSGFVGRLSKATAGTSVQFQIPVPNDVNLSGLTVHAQSVVVGGGSAQLCNAIAATAGT